MALALAYQAMCNRQLVKDKVQVVTLTLSLTALLMQRVLGYLWLHDPAKQVGLDHPAIRALSRSSYDVADRQTNA